jgi:hypothetical protein
MLHRIPWQQYSPVAECKAWLNSNPKVFGTEYILHHVTDEVEILAITKK